MAMERNERSGGFGLCGFVLNSGRDVGGGRARRVLALLMAEEESKEREKSEERQGRKWLSHSTNSHVHQVEWRNNLEHVSNEMKR